MLLGRVEAARAAERKRAAKLLHQQQQVEAEAEERKRKREEVVPQEPAAATATAAAGGAQQGVPVGSVAVVATGNGTADKGGDEPGPKRVKQEAEIHHDADAEPATVQPAAADAGAEMSTAPHDAQGPGDVQPPPAEEAGQGLGPAAMEVEDATGPEQGQQREQGGEAPGAAASLAAADSAVPAVDEEDAGKAKSAAPIAAGGGGAAADAVLEPVGAPQSVEDAAAPADMRAPVMPAGAGVGQAATAKDVHHTTGDEQLKKPVTRLVTDKRLLLAFRWARPAHSGVRASGNAGLDSCHALHMHHLFDSPVPAVGRRSSMHTWQSPWCCPAAGLHWGAAGESSKQDVCRPTSMIWATRLATARTPPYLALPRHIYSCDSLPPHPCSVCFDAGLFYAKLQVF